MTIRQRIFIPLIVVMVCSISMTLLMEQQVAEMLVKQHTQELGSMVAEAVNREFNIFTDASLHNMRVMAQRAELRNLTKDGNPEASKTIRQLLTYITRSSDRADWVRVLNSEGICVVSSHPEMEGHSFANEADFQLAIQGRERVTFNTTEEAQYEKAYIIIAMPVREHGKVIGVLNISTNMEYLNRKIVDNFSYMTRSNVFLVSDHGSVFMHPDRQQLQQQNADIKALVAQFKDMQTEVLEYSENGEERLAYYTPMPGTRWTIVFTESRQKSASKLASARYYTLFVPLFFLLLGGGILYYLVSILTTALTRTVKFAQAVAKGDLEQHCDVNRNDEIGVLANSLNLMLDRLKSTIHMLDRQTEELQAAAQKNQRALHEFDVFLNNVDCGVAKIVFKDLKRTVLWGNDGFYALTGYTRDEYAVGKGANPKNILHPDDLERVLKAFQEHSLRRDSLVLEYRIFNRHGALLWLYVKSIYLDEEGDCPIFISVMLNITEQKVMQEKLEWERQRYAIVSHLSQEMLFEYNVQGKVFKAIGDQQGLMMRFGFVGDVQSNLIHTDAVHPDDLATVLEVFHDNGTGKKYSRTVKVRIRTPGQEYQWYYLIYHTLANEVGIHVATIGKFVNVHAEVQRIEELKRKASIDQMTNLFDKASTERIITEILREWSESIHAMLILDLDDFKRANDDYGTFWGDEVLKSVGITLKKAFDGVDLVGRIGGDEFLVFAKDISGPQEVEQKLASFYEQIHALHVLDNAHYTVSASAGISLYPKHGITYEELFRAAEHALCMNKKYGRGTYSFD